MRTTGLILAVALALGGCAGIEIDPLTPVEAAAAHARPGASPGYVVYEPMVIVHVARVTECLDKSKCEHPEIRCTVSQPMLWPDYSKPYRVNVKSGFGRSAVDVKIENGWMLGEFKDNSDNTALWSTISKLAEASFGTRAVESGQALDTCFGLAPGLYRIDPATSTLAPLKPG